MNKILETIRLISEGKLDEAREVVNSVLITKSVNLLDEAREVIAESLFVESDEVSDKPSKDKNLAAEIRKKLIKRKNKEQSKGGPQEIGEDTSAKKFGKAQAFAKGGKQFVDCAKVTSRKGFHEDVESIIVTGKDKKEEPRTGAKFKTSDRKDKYDDNDTDRIITTGKAKRKSDPDDVDRVITTGKLKEGNIQEVSKELLNRYKIKSQANVRHIDANPETDTKKWAKNFDTRMNRVHGQMRANRLLKKKVTNEDHWMQKLHLRKGALTKKANRAGETPNEFAHEHEHDSGRTGKQARLALVFAKARH